MAHQLLWLLRHGDAVPHGAKPDAERELTPRGERQAAAAGAALAQLGPGVAACYTSPLVRALETARHACQALGVQPAPRAVVGKGFDLDVVRDLLAAHDDGEQVLVVGHNPAFEQVVLDLTGARVDFKKGGLAAIRVSGPSGVLLALLRPRELQSIALAPAGDD